MAFQTEKGGHMKNICWANSRLFECAWGSTSRKIALLAALGVAAVALATPPSGFITNLILAKGVVLNNINQHVQIPRNQERSVDPWQVHLGAQGATDFYVQHLELVAGGYSGWHSHPGVLIGTVKSGSIDFYDADCRKRTIAAGEVFQENDGVHGIINTGGVNADLWIAYLIKHNAPRRLEESAPACAFSTGIP
jgi:quercetin dioxygenase-like cupin family protein